MKDTSTRTRSILAYVAPIEFNFRKKSASAAGKSRRWVRLITTVCFAQMLMIVLYLPNATTSSFDEEPKSYKIETKETATFYTGREGKIIIVLLDQNGNRIKANRDMKATITATTLPTLDEAKQRLNSRPAVQQSKRASGLSRNNNLVLPRGQDVAQITIMHERGEEDKDAHVISYQTGRLHIFVEAENITPGETSVVVLDSARNSSPYRRISANQEEGMLLPVRLQNNNSPSLKLVFSPQKPSLITLGGEQVAYIRVELQYDNSDEYVKAPEDIKVVLEVEDGYARFEPNTLVIPKDDVNTLEQTALKTIPGGLIKIKAKARRPDGVIIKSGQKEYTFKRGPCSESLVIHQQRHSAVANGLDGIELRVEALQQDGRTILPEEEGMEERRIFLELDGDTSGVRFENENGEVRIPKGQTAGRMKVFSTRSVSGLKVIAKSQNGLREQIKSPDTFVPINFSFPWLQLLFAAIGGAAFPLLQKQKYLKMLQGLAAGVVFFALSFFGALVSNPQSIGGVSAVLTKIPTENLFASLVLGFLGGLLLMSIFKLRQPRSA